MWIHQLVDAGEVEVEWGVFSLIIQNAEDFDEIDPQTGRGLPALRTVIAIRDRHGNDAVGRFYARLDHLVWEESRSISDPAVIEEALAAAELPTDLLAIALDDPSTWAVLVEEHRVVKEGVGAFGVPTITLDGDDGPGIFGPVISSVPESVEEAVELWRHVSWLTRYGNFSELKRDRPPPDLETYRQRAAKAAAKD